MITDLKSKCWQDCPPSRNCREEPPLISDDCWQSLVYGHITPVSAPMANCILFFCLPSLLLCQISHCLFYKNTCDCTYTGEGNGNPLQYSCLENPVDGGAWWAISIGSHRVGHDWSDLAVPAALLPHPDNPELFPITRFIITSAVSLFPDKVTFTASGISLRAIIQPSSRHKGLGQALDKNIQMSVKFSQVTPISKFYHPMKIRTLTVKYYKKTNWQSFYAIVFIVLGDNLERFLLLKTEVRERSKILDTENEKDIKNMESRE